MTKLPRLTELSDMGGEAWQSLMTQVLYAHADRLGFEYRPGPTPGPDHGVDGFAPEGGLPGMGGPVIFQAKWMWGDLHKGSKRAKIVESLNRAADEEEAACRRFILESLRSLIEGGHLPPPDRAAAGIALGKLGDPRPGVGLRADGLPDLAFDAVLPAGDFTLAQNGQTVGIAEPYRLSRYPVTVAQYRTFCDAGGYGVADGPKPPWWSEEGWRWRNGQLDTKGWEWWERDWYARQTFPILSPEDYAPVFQTPNHPRVGVSWYEATAFCGWLTGRLRASGQLGQEEAITLPTEAQWEQAARWNKMTGAADGRLYPWGRSEEKDMAQRCNMAETGLGHTSAVGMFPTGQAECDALDMSGNVREWCENLYSRNEHYRVLRGGSWGIDYPEILRCSYRDVGTPDLRSQDYGFRCVWWLGVSAPR